MKFEIAEIRKRHSDALDADQENRDAGLDDLAFVAGDQWPEKVKQARESEDRPCLTINQMPQFVRQVTGDIRQTNPGIDVIPGDGDATQEMAEAFDGIIRGIEYRSSASSVYERAAESAAACGIGNFRVLYSDSGFGNEVYIESIPSPFSVVWDPLSQDPARRDARYCLVTTEVDRDDFAEMYPGAQLVEVDRINEDRYYKNWVTTDTILVAEYWCKTEDGIYMVKVSGAELLEDPVKWPGAHIPVVAVVGEELHIGRRVVRSSVIRYAKDSARMYNFMRSAQAEVIGMQPKAPYKITPMQLKGNESYWNSANSTTRPYLLYNPDPQAPAPTREAPPLSSAALTQEIAVAADEMKATTGIYNAALGGQSNETSGVAIRQRQQESDLSTSIYIDNMSKSIEQCGRILVDLIPRIYDTTRSVQMVGIDGKASLIEVNTPMQTPYGPMYLNDLSVGRFDVRVKTGPSFTTQRQEAVEKMLSFANAIPNSAGAIGDLVARNMDWPGADELADRLAKMLPPELQETPEEMTPEQRMQMQQQMQMQKMLQQMEMQKLQAETAEATAEAKEAEAEAQKAALEVQEKQMAMAIQSGQMNEAIAQIVQEEVARALQALNAQRAF